MATFFDSADEFRAWLAEHHSTETELWMGLRKAHVSPRGLTWAEAVPVALCFGWIDSTSRPIDDVSREQRWTPRRKGSIWSTVNIAHAQRLITEGLMEPAGLTAFEARRADRSGVYSFEQESTEPPVWLEEMLRADSTAAHFFYERATPSYRKVCVHWVISAKTEVTRRKRAAELVADSAAGRLIKSQRYGTLPAWAREF